MPYGTLGTIKTIGVKPVFCLLDANGKPIMAIPDIEDWLLKKIGHKLDIFVSDDHFHLTSVGNT